jgi:hypothetical protein
MKRIIFIFLLIILCGFNLFAQAEITREEYDFYAKFLRCRCVIKRFTESLHPRYIKAAKKKMPQMPPELLEDFNRKNRESYRISEKLKGFRFSDEPKPNLDTTKEIVLNFDLIITVSRVGFSRDKKQALVFHSPYSEATTGGTTAIYWLVYKNGNWEIKDSFQPWIH